MLTRMATEMRDTLKPFDPAAGHRSAVPEEARQDDLRRILATPPRDDTKRHVSRPVGRRTSGRRLAWGSGAAAVVAGAVVATLTLGGSPSLAYEATPAPLVITATSDARPAGDVLREIAGRAGKLPATTGAYQHLVTESWSLWTRVDDERVVSAVVPARTESWRGDDGSGKVVVGTGEPYFPSAEHREAWEDDGSFGDGDKPQTELFGAGQFPAMWKDAPPADPAKLADWLAIAHPRENGPAETIVAVTDLARERVLDPALRAGVLRVLATLPGLTHEGAVVDRMGRAGEAFVLVSDFSGLPTHYTLVVDPRTGELLGYEKELRTEAGKLDVKLPAVIGYDLFVTAGRTAQPN
ncbi:CU044_5270 family protein [Actinoplanes missouriensis]|uniref:CU044_5270 family protein n=1 Tax=Actinoplanes missouriensis TaxID=1866 RepID=UPI0034047CEF